MGVVGGIMWKLAVLLVVAVGVESYHRPRPPGGRPPPSGGSGSRPPPSGGSGNRPPPSGGMGGGGGNGGTGGTGTGGTGTTTFSTAEEFVSAALSAAAAGSCNRMGANSFYTCSGNSCGSGLESTYREELDGAWRIIVANGIPSHSYSVGADRPNPNEVCTHNVFLRVPASPTKGAFTASGMGPVGVALSGAFFYNHLSSPTGALAAVN